MARRKHERMSPGKKNLIASLIEILLECIISLNSFCPVVTLIFYGGYIVNGEVVERRWSNHSKQ